jgi:hypothetical protein
MFVHPGCTNSTLRHDARGSLPESVCVPESPTGPVVLSPICVCSGITIAGSYSLFIR